MHFVWIVSYILLHNLLYNSVDGKSVLLITNGVNVANNKDQRQSDIYFQQKFNDFIEQNVIETLPATVKPQNSDTHENNNKWTATLNDFFRKLPNAHN